MFNLSKFLSGFAIWQGEKLGKILFVMVICVFTMASAFGIYHKLTQKSTENNTVIPNAQNVTIDQRQDFVDKEKFFIGVKLWGFRLGGSYSQRSQVQGYTGQVGKADLKTQKP